MLASVILTLAVAEAVSRVVLGPMTTIHVENLDSTVPSGEQSIETVGSPNDGLYVRTPTGLRLKRNSRAMVRNHWLSHADIEITTNAQGFRHPRLAPKGDNELRVLVLGDSVTFGDYVPEDQTYPAYIGAFLRQAPPAGLEDRDIQVINAGIGAVDLENEFAVLMDTGLSVEPDIVIVGLYLNDAKLSLALKVSRVPGPSRPSRFLSWVFTRIDRLRLTSSTPNDDLASMQAARGVFRASHPVSRDDWRAGAGGFNRLIDESFGDWGFAWSDEYWARVREVLSLMADVSRAEGFRLAVVLLPVSYQVQAEILRDEPQRRFAEELGTLGVAHLDPLPDLRAHFSETGENIYYDHCHMKPAGNRLIGRRIADFLNREHLLEPGP